MIKRLLIAAVLALAPIGQAFAITEADIDALSAIAEKGGDVKSGVLDYMTNAGETVRVFEGDKAVKFAEALYMFGAVQQVPDGITTIFYGDVDPSDGTVLVHAFHADGSVIGAIWVPYEIAQASADAALAGI